MEVHSNQKAICKADLWNTSNPGNIKCTPLYARYKRTLKGELPTSITYDPRKKILAEITVRDKSRVSISEYIKAPIDVVSWNLHPSKNDQNVRHIKITRIESDEENFSIKMSNVD